MNRLTKDLNTPHDDTTYADVVKDCVDRENIVLTKLKHYEDIEDEIGIDLITLFKALKGSIFYIDFDGKLNSAYRPYMVLGDHYYIFDLDNIHIGVRDYGKKWAFTKEELEVK